MERSKYLPVGRGAVLAVQQVLPQTGRALHRDWTCKPVAAEKGHPSLNDERCLLRIIMHVCWLSHVMNAGFTVRH